MAREHKGRERMERKGEERKDNTRNAMGKIMK
jgi:hypothetical protein